MMSVDRLKPVFDLWRMSIMMIVMATSVAAAKLIVAVESFYTSVRMEGDRSVGTTLQRV